MKNILFVVAVMNLKIIHPKMVHIINGSVNIKIRTISKSFRYMTLNFQCFIKINVENLKLFYKCYYFLSKLCL